MAYRWIYDVLLSLFHSMFHLMGVSVYGLLLTLVVAYSVFWMTRRSSGCFWRPCLLATVCCGYISLQHIPPTRIFLDDALRGYADPAAGVPTKRTATADLLAPAALSAPGEPTHAVQQAAW
jgi:hypothetical protein